MHTHSWFRLPMVELILFAFREAFCCQHAWLNSTSLYRQGPILLLQQGYKRHGEVFTVPVLHKKITFILGPHASPHFYKATDDDMSQTEVRPCALAMPSCACFVATTYRSSHCSISTQHVFAAR